MKNEVARSKQAYSNETEVIINEIKNVKFSGWLTFAAIPVGFYYYGLLINNMKGILVPMIIALFLLFLSIKFSEFTIRALLNIHEIFLKISIYRKLSEILKISSKKIYALQDSLFWKFIPIWKLIPSLKMISVAASLIFVFGGLILSYSVLNKNIEKIQSEIPTYQKSINKSIEEPKQWLQKNYPDISKRVTKHIDTVAQTINQNINISFIVSTVSGTIGGFASQSFKVLLFYLFFGVSYKHLPKKIEELDNSTNKKISIKNIANDISEKISIYLKVKTGASLATGICAYILLRAVGVDFPDVWALGVFFLNFIPNVGSLISAVPPILMTVVIFGFSMKILVVAGGLMAINIIIGSVIEPKFMGEKLNLAAWVILAALLGFSEMLGTAGAFFCVIITAFVFQIMANLDESKFIAIVISDKGNIGKLTI